MNCGNNPATKEIDGGKAPTCGASAVRPAQQPRGVEAKPRGGSGRHPRASFEVAAAMAMHMPRPAARGRGFG